MLRVPRKPISFGRDRRFSSSGTGRALFFLNDPFRINECTLKSNLSYVKRLLTPCIDGGNMRLSKSIPCFGGRKQTMWPF